MQSLQTQKPAKWSKLWPVLALLPIAIGSSGAYLLRQNRANVSNFEGRSVPEEGLLTNPNAAYAGTTADAENDLRTLHKALTEYRAKYQMLPSDPADLIQASSLGQIATKVGAENFHAPGFETSDSFSPDKSASQYTFSYAARRADGSEKPPFPKPGQRDTWIVCDTYARRNTRIFQDGHQAAKPEGDFLVLWSDGEVARVPSMGRVVVETNDGARMFFSGETGLPKKTVSERDFLLKMYRNTGPQPMPPLKK